MPTSFADQIAVHAVEKDVFESKLHPHRMGNTMPIAYGGNTLAVSLNAAAQTVQSHLRAYSAMGFFLGPAQIDRPLRCRIQRVRDTRTFATRRIIVEQTLDNGKRRACLEVTVDFQAVEEPFMKYSAAPSRQYSNVEQSLSYADAFKTLHAKGQLSDEDWERFNTMFGAGLSFIDQKQCPEGVSAQNLGGFAKHTQTNLDHLHITDKASAEYVRTKEPLPESSQLAALSYILDGALSFTPLVHDHKFLEDAGACSSLDFALRIFTPTIKIDEWHLRERKTIAANAGRTYTEARYWNGNGELIAIMSQQSIMRSAPPPKATL